MRLAILSLVALGFAVACTPTSTEPPKAEAEAEARPLTAEQLMGAPWRVVSVNGAAGEPAPTMLFGEDGRVSGNASCNQYSAAFALDGDKLTFTQALSTMMACPDVDMEIEQRFLTTLAEVERAEIGADGSLLLHARNNGQIVARRS